MNTRSKKASEEATPPRGRPNKSISEIVKAQLIVDIEDSDDRSIGIEELRKIRHELYNSDKKTIKATNNHYHHLKRLGATNPKQYWQTYIDAQKLLANVTVVEELVAEGETAKDLAAQEGESFEYQSAEESSTKKWSSSPKSKKRRKESIVSSLFTEPEPLSTDLSEQTEDIVVVEQPPQKARSKMNVSNLDDIMKRLVPEGAEYGESTLVFSLVCYNYASFEWPR